MASTNILSLPNELLEHVFSYLDWDQRTSVTPHRPDIISTSLTCSQLRLAILPILFRHVKLTLRWDVASLLEPKLFALRRQCPQLMKYVRSVHLECKFGHLKNQDRLEPPFRVPENLRDWLDPTESVPADYPKEKIQAHRERVEAIARRLLTSEEYIDTLRNSPLSLRRHAKALTETLFGDNIVSDAFITPDEATAVEDEIGVPGTQASVSNTMLREQDEQSIAIAHRINARFQALQSFTTDTGPRARPGETPARSEDRRKARLLRQQLDAMVLVMLCFPPTVRTFILQAIPDWRRDSYQNDFALTVGSLVFEIFGDRLEDLGMVYVPSETSNDSHNILHPGILLCLQNVKRFTLDLNKNTIGSRTTVSQITRDLQCWHALSTITDLTLSHVSGEPMQLADYIANFTQLRRLALTNVYLSPPFHVIRQFRDSKVQVWLSFLIDVRQRLPRVNIELAHMKGCNAEDGLQGSAVRWLLEEAVPVGAVIDAERKTRLIEDFVSFAPLWMAEDSERGRLAEEDREDGRLVDLAMANRGRGMF